MSSRGGEGHRGTSGPERNSIIGAAIPVTADSPVSFKSRESREGATVSLIFSENPEPSRLSGGARGIRTAGTDL
jgi:hypothetical protein